MSRFTKSLDLVRDRFAQRTSDPSAMTDVVYGMERLMEAMSEAPMIAGRKAMLGDLRKKTAQAESSHDPMVVQDLITALTAFLNEEMKEGPERHDEPDGDEDQDGNEPEGPEENDESEGDAQNEQRGANSGQDVEEESESEMTDMASLPEELPSTSEDDPDTDAATAQGDTPTLKTDRAPGLKDKAPMQNFREYTCEACGHKNNVGSNPPFGAKMGGKMAATNKLASGSKMTAQRESDSGLSDEERRELQALRMEKRTRLIEAERLKKASTAIATAAEQNRVDAEVLSELLPATELRAFHESQWPTLINVALRNAPSVPAGFVGTGEIAMPSPGRSARTTKREAGSLFRSRFGGSASKNHDGAA